MTIQNLATQEFKVKWDEWTLVDSLMPAFFSGAIRQYNRYAPRTLYAVLETVEDQSDYELPSTCVEVLEVEWYPDDVLLANKTIAHVDATSPFDPQPADHVDHLIRDTTARWEHIDRLGGWYLKGQTTLSLIPTPSRSGIGVYVTYASVHVELSGEYTTIPVRHVGALADFMVAEALGRRAAGHAGHPDARQGLTAWTRRHAATDANAEIRRRRADAIAQILEDI